MIILPFSILKILQTWIQFGTMNLSAENPCHTPQAHTITLTRITPFIIYIYPSLITLVSRQQKKRTHITRNLENMAAVAGESSSVWKFMTLGISREVPMFNFEGLDILCAWIVLSCDKLWAYGFLESIRFSISNVSIYYTSESDLRVICYDHLSFSSASVVQFRASRYNMRLNRTSVW